ncbi:(R)-mandelonitrile lyase-like [Vitis vinifera]|uniref:(R)-mandelonitrile lyase-like n=1 Tax=Vitis vinifera TaxID=29760 RepID=A0A438JZU6_VITVI|nr:(R)-mandelonitrile lyase-like [Vitis vinifera]
MAKPMSSSPSFLALLIVLASTTSLEDSFHKEKRMESPSRASIGSIDVNLSPSYSKFVVNATEMPPEDYYDYIVVGGGTAGCPLAATLSENFRVLVLERGGVPYTNPNLMSQDGFLTSLMEADPYDSPAQTFTSEDGVANARGRVLGGSSAINAGFYSRADEDFYKKIRAEMGPPHCQSVV